MILAIDPSINKMGICLLQKRKILLLKTVTSKGKTLWDKAESLILQTEEHVGKRVVEIGAIEIPSTYSWNKNSNLTKLWYAVGRLDQWLSTRCVRVHRIPVEKLKRSKSKIQTIREVNLVHGLALRESERGSDSHKADAVKVAEYAEQTDKLL